MQKNLVTAARGSSLGNIIPTEANAEAWVKAIIEQRRAAILSGRLPVPKNTLYLHLPPTYEEYLEAASRHSSIVKHYNRGDYTGSVAILAASLNWRLHYKKDFSGYVSYLTDFFAREGRETGQGSAMSDTFRAKLENTPVPQIDERVRWQGHTAIYGGTGSGKSELMKALAFHDICEGEAALVVIDPKRKFGEEVARWPEVVSAGRLVFLGYTEEGGAVGFNPLDGRGLNERGRAALATSLVTMLGELLADESEPTTRMKVLLQNCFRLLLDSEGATFHDLHDMLGDPESPKVKRWIEKGLRHPDDYVRSFFEEDFRSKDMNTSRSGLRFRLQSMLGRLQFRERYCRVGGLNIGKALDEKRVVVFDFGDCEDDETETLCTRVVIAAAAGIASRRMASGKFSHKPYVHVYLDEARKSFGASFTKIIREARKAGVLLTFSDQLEGGNGQSAFERREIQENVAVKLVSTLANPAEVRNILGHETPSEYTKAQGVFWVLWGRDSDPAMLQVRSDLRDTARGINGKRWQAEKRAQWERHRAPARLPPKQAAEPPPPETGPKTFRGIPR